MSLEEGIQKELVKKFPFLENNIRIQRKRRIFLDVPTQNFREVLEHAVKNIDFSILSAITGLDQGEVFGLIYHLSSEDGVVLSIKTSVPKDNPAVKTVTEYFSSAEIYEREMVDLLGIKVEGLPEGKRYPLPDDWPKDEHPLRKDWKSRASKGKGTAKDA